ncbi:MAG: ferritin family protein [Deltaproteobacteria bacterium]|nr:ferritin family protein [Deltaproteobacteria bacterium]
MNPVHFTGEELIDMAVRIEENGFRFYTDAAKAAKSKSVKDTFAMLAAEEKEHIKIFAAFRKLLSDKGSFGFDPYGEEAELYLKALADSEVFTRSDAGAKLAAKVKDERQAINAAISMEKDSLLFYYEMQKMIRGKDKVVLDKLIEQEREHLRKLTVLQKDLG